MLVVAMAPLHLPGREPGVNAIRALADLSDRGHPAGMLAADNAYSAQRPENFQLPARSLGYDLVFKYRVDQLGVQATSKGLPRWRVVGTARRCRRIWSMRRTIVSPG